MFETQDRHFATGGSSEPTLNPEFYKMFELDCVFPTLSHLVIELFDAKVWVSCINRSRAAARTNSYVFVCQTTTGVDELVGATYIDLEERWYNDQWQAALQEKRVPVEFRTLYADADAEAISGGLEPVGAVPQGKVEVILCSQVCVILHHIKLCRTLP